MKHGKWMSKGLVIASLLLVTACGSKATTTGTSAKPTDQAAASPTPAVAATSAPATSQTVQQIKKNGKLVIGTSGNFRPMTFMNEQSQITGLDIDIGTMIAEKLGVKIEFVPGNIAGLIPGLVAGKFDLVMSALSETDERRRVLISPFLMAKTAR